nr:MAG TPA: hypothetical protein [Caudoviricetes sp.]
MKEGDNQRDQEKGLPPLSLSLRFSPSFILTSVLIRIANPRSAVRQKELS